MYLTLIGRALYPPIRVKFGAMCCKQRFTNKFDDMTRAHPVGVKEGQAEIFIVVRGGILDSHQGGKPGERHRPDQFGGEPQDTDLGRVIHPGDNPIPRVQHFL